MTKHDSEESGGVKTVGVRIRPMENVDLGRILELRRVVRWSADPHSFGVLRGLREARWAVAEPGGAAGGPLAGMVGAVPLGKPPGVGILCHLAVHGDYRGLGLGARLSRWAVAYLRGRGARTVRLYSTPQATNLYLSLGFSMGVRRTVYRLEEAREAYRVRRMPGRICGYRVDTLLSGDLPELCGVDHWTYGADRTALLLATLRLHPGRGLVVRDESGRIKGYLLRSASPRGTRVGPFVAETPNVARLLLAGALADIAGPAEATVAAPPESPAHGLLEEFGFEGREDRLGMNLGEEPPRYPLGLTQYGTTPYLAT